jgi:hypothetical protein
MNRTLMLVLGWLAATLVAVGVAWGGVQMVSGRVVRPLPLTALTTSPGPSPTVGSETPRPSPSSPSPTRTAEPGDSASPSPLTGPSETSAPPTSAPPATPDGTGTTTAPTSPVSSPEQTPAAEPEVRSYELVGGSVTLRFEPGAVTIVKAVPRSGFRLKMEGSGSNEATVEFEGEEHHSKVKGWWENGPRDRVEEDAESEDDHVESARTSDVATGTVDPVPEADH